jgi:predicted dehydrogenase
MSHQIGVGILGANPERGWAARSHIPAINASPHFALAAVATTRAETANAARDRFGARHAFTDALSLARHPDVDLVVVTVKVPAHAELVRAALDAGKHVYCEWPLTRTAAEARALQAAAETAGGDLRSVSADD